MNQDKLTHLIATLDLAVGKMENAAYEMRSLGDEHPVMRMHGNELFEAVGMIDEWIEGIGSMKKRDIGEDAREAPETTQKPNSRHGKGISR